MVEDADYFGHVLKKPPTSALSNHCHRGCRRILGSYNRHERRDEPHRSTIEAMEKLSWEKIWTNTVLCRSVEFPDRLVKVKFVRKGKFHTGQYEAVQLEVTKENYLETTYPLDYFCLQTFDPCVVSTLEYNLMPAMSLLFDLQKKAEVHGVSHWEQLGKECLPDSWADRTTKRAPKKQTFDGGCEICSWQPGYDAPAPTPLAFDFRYLCERHASNTKTIDLQKLFVKNAGKYPNTMVQLDSSLKRSRTPSIETEAHRSVTPTASRAHDLRTSASAPPALPAKRRKIRHSKKSMGDAAKPREDAQVTELSPAAPLSKGSSYKIKYLQYDDQYKGFWETNTEVDPNSDTETVVDLTAATETTWKGTLPAFSQPNSPPGMQLDHILQAQRKHAIATPESRTGGQPLRGDNYLPIDFLGTGYALEGHSAEQRRGSQDLLTSTPPADPFSSFSSASTFEPFISRDVWDPSQSHDFGRATLESDSKRIGPQSMNSLIQHSGALHVAMGFDLDDNDGTDASSLQFGGTLSAMGPDFPTSMRSSADLQQPSAYNQLASNTGPMTPYKNQRAGDFGSLMFTDEVNRITDFDGLPDLDFQDSPSKNFGSDTTSTINMYPMSPIRASMRPTDRRIFTIHEDDELAFLDGVELFQHD